MGGLLSKAGQSAGVEAAHEIRLGVEKFSSAWQEAVQVFGEKGVLEEISHNFLRGTAEELAGCLDNNMDKVLASADDMRVSLDRNVDRCMEELGRTMPNTAKVVGADATNNIRKGLKEFSDSLIVVSKECTGGARLTMETLCVLANHSLDKAETISNIFTRGGKDIATEVHLGARELGVEAVTKLVDQGIPRLEKAFTNAADKLFRGIATVGAGVILVGIALMPEQRFWLLIYCLPVIILGYFGYRHYLKMSPTISLLPTKRLKYNTKSHLEGGPVSEDTPFTSLLPWKPSEKFDTIHFKPTPSIGFSVSLSDKNSSKDLLQIKSNSSRIWAEFEGKIIMTKKFDTHPDLKSDIEYWIKLESCPNSKILLQVWWKSINQPPLLSTSLQLSQSFDVDLVERFTISSFSRKCATERVKELSCGSITLQNP